MFKPSDFEGWFKHLKDGLKAAERNQVLEQHTTALINLTVYR